MVDPMTVRLETSMVRHQSDVVRRDIRMSSGHPTAVGSDVRVGRVGWVTDILWISVCYQGNFIEMAVCCVVGCGRKYKRNDKDNNPKLYSILIVNPYDPLTQLRRNEWLKRLNLSERGPSYHLIKKDVDWAPNKNLEPQSKGEAVAQRFKRFIKISNLPKPEKGKRETSKLKLCQFGSRLEVLADDAQVVKKPAYSEGTDAQEVDLSEACNVSMLKQEVASLSARVALLESQKRDLELANQDLSERLADLE
uniref:Uncharacterized protein n=1 Tax=Daphnia galeata TaxID=27404 RepID=A0A8J2RMT4_9CRUS|nr:unnamed protein product [Daphnia galeata]